MNPTVLGAIIGVGGSTAAQAVAGYLSTRRYKLRFNEDRLRDLVRVIDVADETLTKAHHHLGSAASLAQEVGALGVSTEDRWENQRQDTKDRAVEDLNALWSHENLIRLRVYEDHPLLLRFNEATEALGQAITVVEELLEPGDRAQRRPVWQSLREARSAAVQAQRDFEAAARDLLGPRLDRVAR
jgi:hypothetical protein